MALLRSPRGKVYGDFAVCLLRPRSGEQDRSRWKKWVDAENRPIWQNGKWTQYATPLQISAGISLRASETGLRQFEKLVNNPAPIQVNINTVDTPGHYGTNEPLIATYTDGSTELLKSVITLYTRETDQYAQENNVSKEASLAGTFGHEIEHTTPLNIQQVVAFKKLYPEDIRKSDESKLIYEIAPYKIKADIIKEMSK